jgi:hypothetical protein
MNFREECLADGFTATVESIEADDEAIIKRHGDWKRRAMQCSGRFLMEVSDQLRVPV